ncbi:hypothetical protein THAOC_07613 [Thalassiosira oceanica]|uniref:MYND-type domain-containing protein n=1 Tax=Thalassiosira oceanica TaxID=159749 RepID=K0SZV6_THAOC|nr:hypothetical protein THAOC_07613 [Thalassiosira oceanica]|eukprot:EJK70985.1 hypothetical protein THAOC_07613 [Thalassiosira oceanica]
MARAVSFIHHPKRLNIGGEESTAPQRPRAGPRHGSPTGVVALWSASARVIKVITSLYLEEVCANCGKEGSDAVKLKNCTACYVVKYGSVDCQKIHRKKHKKACKGRAAELRDEKLYSQGHEREEGDFCPLCLLPVPPPTQEHAILNAFCMKSICKGCCLAAKKGVLGKICPFCRSPVPKSGKGVVEMVMKRVAAKDPDAIQNLGNLGIWLGRVW